MRAILYRIASCFAITAVAVAGLHAQTKKQKSPRAIAVVRWQPDEQGNARPVLLPIAILIDGKYFDANLYRATPRPFSLDPGTLYEAQDKGELLGFFTIENATKDPHAERWVGLGTWKNETPRGELDFTKPQATITPDVATPQGEIDENERKRKTKIVYDEEGRPIENPGEEPATKRGAPEPLERSPQIGRTPKKQEPTAPTNPDEDPDRPRIRRGPPTPKQEPAAETQAPAAKPQDQISTVFKTGSAAPTAQDDPDRPIIRRGRPAPEAKKTDSAQTTLPLPSRVAERPSIHLPHGKVYDTVAVSDAEESANPRQYRLRVNDDERAEYLKKMAAIAEQELQKKISGQTLRKARTTTPFQNPRLDILDLDFNNSAELVFTGETTRNGERYFVTVVARTNVHNEPRRLFSQVTTQRTLDAQPRLELVDAVDSNGDGRAELLFEQVGKDFAGFVLYRADPEGLTQLFRAAAGD